MRRVTIQVMQDDIDQGHFCNVEHCPVARAASRAFGYKIVASPLGLCTDDGSFRVVLPKDVLQWMRTYDSTKGRTSLPFSFEVEVT